MNITKKTLFHVKEDGPGQWAIYSERGEKVAVVFDEAAGKLLVDSFNLAAFLYL